MEFQSAGPSVVKSIKQRDLLNTWLRLYARNQSIPRMSEYQPARIEDELPDLVFYTVDTGTQPPRLTIQSDGTRMSTRLWEYRQGPLSRRVSRRKARSDRDAGLL